MPTQRARSALSSRSSATSSGEPPGQHRDDRADEDAGDLGGGEGRAEQRHRDRGEERRQRQPDLERRTREDQRRRLVAPQGVADEAAALEQVARDADVVGGVLGLGEHDLGREVGARDERDDEDQRARSATISRRVTAPAPPGTRPDERARPSARTGSPRARPGDRPPSRIGATASTLSSRSSTSQRMS